MAKKRFDPFDYPKGKIPDYLPVNCAVAFFDVVGFTDDTTNEEMKNIIRSIHDVIESCLWDEYDWDERKGGKHNDLILIPTGDGCAIGFHPSKFSNDEILQIVKGLYLHLRGKDLSIRIGIAKGNNIRYKDMNDHVNLFGFGINVAARVMDIALENQILVHETFAKDALGGKDKDMFIDFGEYTIKHGVKINIYNYYKEGEFGNPNKPIKEN